MSMSNEPRAKRIFSDFIVHAVEVLPGAVSSTSSFAASNHPEKPHRVTFLRSIVE